MKDPLLLVEGIVSANVPNATHTTDLLRLQVSVTIARTNIESIVSLHPPSSLNTGVVQPGPSIGEKHLELTISDNSQLRLQFFFKCPICKGSNGTNNLPIESFSHKHKCFVTHCLLCKTKIRVAMCESWCSDCIDRIECILMPLSKIQSGEPDGSQEYPCAV